MQRQHGLQRVLRLIIQFVIAIVCSVLVGAGLMILVYCMPAQPVKDNIWRSYSIYTNEGAYPMWAGDGYKLSQLDNVTDGYMLLEAIYPGNDNPVYNAMMNPYISYAEEINPQQAVLMQAHGTDAPSHETTYSRYWHGYLLFVKPLMTILDLGDLRILNMILVLGLSFLLITRTRQALGRKMALAMFVMWMVLSPVSVVMSFQFSTTFYVMLAASLLVLRCHNWLTQGTRYPMFFLFVGIITNFIDFLTYPMVGMAVPLVLAILMRERRGERHVVLFGMVSSIAWGIGYAGMWIGKWVIGTLLTGQDVIGSAIYEAGVQSTGQDEIFGTKVTAINSILKNVRVIVKWPYVILVAAILLYGIWCLLRRQCRLQLRGNLTDLALLVIALFPMAWYSLFQGHSISCYWFTYRNLCITILAGMAFLGRRMIGRQRQADLTDADAALGGNYVS